MSIDKYLEIYNTISKALYDNCENNLDIGVYIKLGTLKEELETVIGAIAKDEGIGICWGSYGATIDDRL